MTDPIGLNQLTPSQMLQISQSAASQLPLPEARGDEACRSSDEALAVQGGSGWRRSNSLRTRRGSGSTPSTPQRKPSQMNNPAPTEPPAPTESRSDRDRRATLGSSSSSPGGRRRSCPWLLSEDEDDEPPASILRSDLGPSSSDLGTGWKSKDERKKLKMLPNLRSPNPRLPAVTTNPNLRFKILNSRLSHRVTLDFL